MFLTGRIHGRDEICVIECISGKKDRSAGNVLLRIIGSVLACVVVLVIGRYL